MELITALIVLISILLVIFFNPKIIRVILQFFVLNLIISTFYLLGVGLMLFQAYPIGGFTLSFTALFMSFDACSVVLQESPGLFLFYKLVVLVGLITFFSKLTLAPFSV